MTLLDPNALADRYVTMWVEPDPAMRRKIIEELWAPDGVHLLEPPEEARAAADRLGVGVIFEAAGHDAIERRVTAAYDDFVAGQGFTFRSPGDARRIRDTVMFRWESVQKGEVVGGGTEFLILDAGGRIAADHMFPG
ncbi:hypothetical protein [Paractinoplanes globisporus]|uniref:SnoaL-like domain-containing protein n=1 Tax=Paractinoplanes globisporus TaxID=113565 RepID=A0ABW6WDN0_9ACTN|nr:hypothetical protein [Actinoplanes globisporus]